MKRILKCVREYKAPTFITFIFIIIEALIETQIPTITANLVNKIERFDGLSGAAANAAMSDLSHTGLKLLVMALISLACGGLAGFLLKSGGGLFKEYQT